MNEKLKDLPLEEMDYWMEGRFKPMWLASIFAPGGWLKMLRSLEVWGGSDACIKRIVDDMDKLDMGIGCIAPDDEKDYGGWYWVGRRWWYWYKSKCNDAPRWIEDGNGSDMQGCVRGDCDE